jgi:hypothetical protein
VLRVLGQQRLNNFIKVMPVDYKVGVGKTQSRKKAAQTTLKASF